MKVTLSNILYIEDMILYLKKEIDRHEFVTQMNSLHETFTDEKKKIFSDYRDKLYQHWFDFVDRLCYFYLDLDKITPHDTDAVSKKKYIRDNYTDYIRKVSKLTSKHIYIHQFIEIFPDK